MKKNFAFAITLTLMLSATAPASAAFVRDGGGGRDRGISPIERVIRVIKKIFTIMPHEGWEQPHP